jgi:hypothetical protein
MAMKRIIFFCSSLLILFSCGYKISVTAEEFCGEMPKLICDKIFKGGCLEDELGLSSSRYGSNDECRLAEQKSCVALSADEALDFNGEKAQQCLTEIKKKKCPKAMRGDFPSCSGIFKEIEAPIEDLREEAGSPTEQAEEEE